MPILLNIDTATEVASVCITRNGLSLAFERNDYQKEHASFVHTAIGEMLKKTGLILKDVDAFAVTSGPGSYTGLRVGMASAKGFCYALSKPLITINTLEVMTKAALDLNEIAIKDWLFCPMIDARRMEVFTAIYNSNMESILPPQPIILEENVFEKYIASDKILFFGSGSTKLKSLQPNLNGMIAAIGHDATHLGKLAEKAFYNRKFADISHSVPTYFKDFHSISMH